MSIALGGLAMNSVSKDTPPGQLVLLEMQHENAIKTFVSEFVPGKDPMHGYFVDLEAPFQEVYDTLTGYAEGIGLPEGWVPSTTCGFGSMRGVIKGVINLRHWLTGLGSVGILGIPLRLHIGARALQRQCWRLCCPKCRAMGIDKVLLSCDVVNTGSVRAIEANGGVCQREEWDEDAQRTSRFYWIETV